VSFSENVKTEQPEKQKDKKIKKKFLNLAFKKNNCSNILQIECKKCFIFAEYLQYSRLKNI